MEKIVNNPAFPHTCRIYRVEGETSFSNGTEKELYSGECMVQCSSSKRTFKGSGVIKSDYAVYISRLIKGINGGCLIDVNDYNGERRGIPISDASPSEIGTTVYFNIPSN